MDPKANLREQLQIARELQEAYESEPFNDTYYAHNGYRLAQLVLALDEWQRHGGFSPYAMPKM